jgi:hypothetical protein
VGKKRADLVTGRQAMVTCCHFVVDEILTAVRIALSRYD